MAIYARKSSIFCRQFLSDIFVALWVLIWCLIARVVYRYIVACAAPFRSLSESSGDLAEDFTHSAQEIGQLPLLGQRLAGLLSNTHHSLIAMSEAADRYVVAIERTSWIAAILVAVIPVALVIAIWLPRRYRFIKESRALVRFVDEQPDLDLIALRGLAHLPMSTLAQISSDPVGRWRARDHLVIEALASAQLKQEGIRLKRRNQRGQSSDL